MRKSVKLCILLCPGFAFALLGAVLLSRAEEDPDASTGTTDEEWMLLGGLACSLIFFVYVVVCVSVYCLLEYREAHAQKRKGMVPFIQVSWPTTSPYAKLYEEEAADEEAGGSSSLLMRDIHRGSAPAAPADGEIRGYVKAMQEVHGMIQQTRDGTSLVEDTSDSALVTQLARKTAVYVPPSTSPLATT